MDQQGFLHIPRAVPVELVSSEYAGPDTSICKISLTSGSAMRSSSSSPSEASRLPRMLAEGDEDVPASRSSPSMATHTGGDGGLATTDFQLRIDGMPMELFSALTWVLSHSVPSHP